MSNGALYLKLGNAQIKMSDIWADEETFREVGSDGMKELMKEDLLSFIEEINLLDHCEFFWRTK